MKWVLTTLADGLGDRKRTDINILVIGKCLTNI